MLFADVRGSTKLGESMPPAQFSKLISRYFAVAAEVLANHHAWVDRFVGDQAVGYFVPGFAGEDHARKAIQAAREILRLTGHSEPSGNEAPSGPWIPVGIGVHTGVAFVGSVGAEGQATDITALGDAPNTAARFSSAAKAGEILVSEEALKQAEILEKGLESRELELKGKSQPVKVYVLQ